MPDHNYHVAVSVGETVLARIVGQTLATVYIEGGTQALVPIYDVLYPPLVAALTDADPTSTSGALRPRWKRSKSHT